jgi:hypothetical protein
LDAGLHAGAYYLAGYSVECALKACIAKQTKESDFPDLEIAKKSYTHNVESLLDTAGLTKDLTDEVSRNATFGRYWGTVKDWKEISRYDLSITDKAAKDLIQAVLDPRDGVLRWVKRYW